MGVGPAQTRSAFCRSASACEGYNHNQCFFTQKNPHENCPKFTVFEHLCYFRSYIPIYDFVFFSVAKDALRDLKYFFSTNNPRLVNFFLGTTIKTFSLKIKTKCRNCRKRTFQSILCHFRSYIPSFPTFVFFVVAKYALRDLKYFFLTKNLRLCEKLSSDRNQSFLTQNIKNSKMHDFGQNVRHSDVFRVYIVTFSTLRDFIAA